MKHILFFVFLFSTVVSSAQSYLLDNEKALFSFTTLKGKKLMIAKDTAGSYLVYRYGSATKIELEYAKERAGSWKKFTYSFYYRGGGIENAGLDLNYLYFDRGKYRYVVYSEYSAEEDHISCGIRVINKKKNKTTDIEGDQSTRKGFLSDAFRWNDLIPKSEEMF